MEDMADASGNEETENREHSSGRESRQRERVMQDMHQDKA